MGYITLLLSDKHQSQTPKLLLRDPPPKKQLFCHLIRNSRSLSTEQSGAVLDMRPRHVSKWGGLQSSGVY